MGKRTKALAKADPVLARYAKQIRAIAKRTVNDLVKIGEILSKAKKRAGHGGYLPWLDRELGWSPDWAQNLVNVFGLSRTARFRKVRHLPATALYLLARKSTPEAAVDVVITRAEAGETITVPIVRQIVSQSVPTPPPVVDTAAEHDAATVIEHERAQRADVTLQQIRRLVIAEGFKDIANLADRVPKATRVGWIDLLDELEQSVSLLKQALMAAAARRSAG